MNSNYRFCEILLKNKYLLIYLKYNDIILKNYLQRGDKYMYYSSTDFSYLNSLKFNFDPIGECNFGNLNLFYSQYVDHDYPFWEWFNDNINCGVIEILR